MRRTSALAAVLLPAMLGVLTSSASAQPRGASEFPKRIAQHLASIDETMTEMHELLERQLETQTLDLLLKRAQLASAEVARIDRTLRRSTEKRTSLDAERRQLEFRVEAVEELQRSRREEGPSDIELENRIRHLRNSIEVTEEALETVDSEIVDLSARLDRKRQDLEAWQEILDRRLSGV